MAPAISQRLVEATFRYPINANSNPTPAKTPSQEAYTQVARSPLILAKPRYIVASQEDFVQDSIERNSPKSAHQPKPLPGIFETNTPVDNDQIVKDSYEPTSLASDPPSQDHPTQQRSIEAHLSDQGLSENNFVDHSIKVLPSVHSPSDDAPQDDSVHPQPSKHCQFQKDVALAESLRAQRVEHNASDNDDHDEDFPDCVRPRVETPSSSKFGVRDITKSLAAEAKSASPQDKGIHSTTSSKRTGTSQPEVSASTAFTMPSMAPKASTSKGTSKSKTPANQSQKRASTSQPSQLPIPEIVNRGETSATTLLQKMRVGATSQTDVRRQVLEPAPPLAPTKSPQKPSSRLSQAIKKPSTKLSQQNQDKSQNRSQKPPKSQSSRNADDAEPSGDDIGEYAVPRSAGKKVTKPPQKTRPAAASVPPNSKRKSQSRKQIAKAPVTDEDDDEDDDDGAYNEPRKTKKSGAAPPKRNTRASTRLQTDKVIKDDGLNVTTRGRATEAAKRAEKLVTQQPPTPRASTAPRATRAEEFDDFEDSTTHVNSGTALKLQPTAQRQLAIPPTEQRKPRPVTDKGAKLMHAISSPSQTVLAITSIATTPKEVPAAERRCFTPADEPIGEQGTTQRHPITVDDDEEDSDNDDAVNASYDDNYNELITLEMSQEEPKRQNKPLAEEPFMKSPPKKAPGSPDQNLTINTHHERSEYLVGEHENRKPHMVGFNDTGPKNQGVSRQKHTGLSLPLPFEEDTSSPDPEGLHVHEPPPLDNTTYYDDTPLPKLHDSAQALEVPVFVSTVGEVASLELGDSALAKPQPNKTVVSVEVTRSYDMGPPPVPKRAVTTVTKQKLVEGTREPIEESQHGNAETRNRPEVAESLARVPSRQSSKQHAAPPRSPQGKEIVTKSSPMPPKPKTSDEPHSRNDQVAPSSKRPENPKPQILVARRDSDQTVVPAQKQPKQDRRSLVDDAEQASHTGASINPTKSDRRPETVANNRSIAFSVEEGAKSRARTYQTEEPEIDRKRSQIAMTKEPAKKQRMSTHGSRQPPAAPMMTANPLMRKPPQLLDNGSPIPFGEEIPQGTDSVDRRRHEISSLLPAIEFIQQSAVDPFAQIIASKQKTNARPENPLEGVSNMHQEWPVQVSQTITHAGFDGDTQVTIGVAQAREPEENQFHTSQRGSPRGLHVTQKCVGLMDALRSEAIPQSGIQDGAHNGDSKEVSEADELMEEDPDKTLVNETSDGDDGDESESENSSDSDDDDKLRDVQSLWRSALESHQGDVYDQMVRIAHRLTMHLKDHETAIEDISNDYRQDGAKLIKRFESDNEERLEQYCIRASKMKGAMVLGFKQVSGMLQKDVKDITMSSDRYGKMLQKQVDAGGSLEQIMQAYHP